MDLGILGGIGANCGNSCLYYRSVHTVYLSQLSQISTAIELRMGATVKKVTPGRIINIYFEYLKSFNYEEFTFNVSSVSAMFTYDRIRSFKLLLTLHNLLLVFSFIFICVIAQNKIYYK